MEGAETIFLLFFSSLLVQKINAAAYDAVTETQFLRAGDTLVSTGGSFEMGFFSPSSSGKTYLGIWYKKISAQTVVWVANREIPLTNASSGVLKLINPGILILVNSANDSTVWSSNATTSAASPIAQLLESGNLVVRDEEDKNQENFLWQSFDYPTDTLLPGMKFGKNLLTGKEWYLSSWKSPEDPAPGEFTWSVDTHGYPQNILKDGESVKFRSGPWNGVGFSGASAFGRNHIYTYDMVNDATEVIFTYTLINSSVVSRLVLNYTGVAQRLVWLEDRKEWQLILNIPKDICDTYSLCGAYASCNLLTSQECECLDKTKFVPRNKYGWETADWSGGCVRRRTLDCKNGNGSDVFLRYSNIKLPDTHNSWVNRSMGLKECEAICSKNCTCTAYANSDVRGGGSGCLLWFNDLMDLRVYTEENRGQDIFVRMAASELVAKRKGEDIKIIILMLILGILVICLSSLLFFYAQRKKKKAKQLQKGEKLHTSDQNESHKEGLELPLFNFSEIANATGSFSPSNKLGQGGFGPVYKGVLEGGQEIAVKRLSKTSSQGVDEFKNEVICISKLQHRNLVKLLGCCIEGDEKLLIYEYMPNRSLDAFLFDTTKSMLLDWTKRFDIIKGIARGLLYLHQDSRLRIIHRDLKASNILLDLDMNPKISDFGIARSFGGNETQANTEKVVGTYGYMSPEYALDGVFSIKSDVYSFGVLVLEIVSGKRNRGFIHPDHQHNLLGHVWRLHDEGRPMELIDASVADSCHPSESEVIRSIQVGLLCVQQSPEDRPNMSSVVLMLGSEGALKQPKPPAFFTERNIFEVDFSSSTYPTSSANDITEVDAR